MTDLAALEWSVMAKFGGALLVLIGVMFGLIVAVVRWQLGAMREGLTKTFDLIGDLEKRVRMLEHLTLATNPDSTIVQRAITGGGND